MQHQIAKTSDDITTGIKVLRDGSMKISVSRPKKTERVFTLTRDAAIDLHDMLEQVLNSKDSTWL